MRDTGPDKAMRLLVHERDQSACVVCGTSQDPWGLSVHHRKPRGRGGDNSPANLVVLCGSGVTGCHGDAESHRTDAYLSGLLVRTGHDPANVPLWHRLYGWCFLDDDGTVALSRRIKATVPAGKCVRCGHRITRGDELLEDVRGANAAQWLRVECCGIVPEASDRNLVDLADIVRARQDEGRRGA